MKKVKRQTPARSASPRGAARKAKAAKKHVAPKGAKRAKGRAAPAAAAPVTPALTIRELDPVRICGDRTSVTHLFRVDETLVPTGKAASSRQVHLVFNDRHGWYCEHGRSCHAVSAVMRHAGIR